MLEWATMAWRERIIFYGSGLRSYFARRAETYPHKMFSLPQYARNAPFLLREFFIITGQTDGRRDTRPMLYACRYRRGQRDKSVGTLKLQDWTLTDDFAGVDIAGLDNDGRMCGQLTEIKLQNFIP